MASYAHELAEEFSINVPVFDESKIEPARRDVDIEPAHSRLIHDFGGSQSKPVKGTEITISIPYTGDSEVFRVHASSHTMDYPRGRITTNRLIFTETGKDLDGQVVRKKFDAWFARIKEHLEGIRRELGNFNEAIEEAAVTALQSRIAKFNKDQDVLDSLGFGSEVKRT